jgi:hypothetical protein
VTSVTPSRFRVFLICAFLSLIAAGARAQTPEPEKPPAEDAPGFKEFSTRVQQFAQLHKNLEQSLPPLKSSDKPELIAAHEQALATKIQESRGKARQGEIFTPDAAKSFRHAIATEFKSSQAANARATIQTGAPIKEVQLEVNQVYPQELPYTSVPPTLLLKFPKLPNELAYRIVAHDLILLDVKANVVVDLIAKAIP